MTRGKPRGICYYKSRQTHCLRGHPFDSRNTIIKIDRLGGIHRECRICDLQRKRELYARKRAAANKSTSLLEGNP
jgi:hypothetical protein